MTHSRTSSGGSPTWSDTIEELVGAAAKGDRGAQQALLGELWPVIRQAVRGRKNRLGSRLAAREQTVDLEQAAALRLLERMPEHEWRGRSAFVAWVKKLARHQASDLYRRHAAGKRSPAAEQPDAEVEEAVALTRSPESRFDDHQRFERLLADVQQLKPEHGAALMMHHLGFSMAEIGEALDCSAEAARKLVARARVKLLSQRDW